MIQPTRDSLPRNWATATLSDFCRIVQGQSPPSDTYNEAAQGLAFFQGKAEFGSLYPVAAKWCTAPKKTATSGDVLISVRAPVGPTNLSPGTCAIGRGLAALRPLEGISSPYLLHALRHTEHALSARASGSTFPAISGDNLRTHQVPLAPLAEQRRIVAEIEKQFTRMDAAEAALRRLRANLKRYRAAVLKAACEGHLVPTEAELARAEGRAREPAGMLRAGTGGRPDVPDGWCWATLSEVAAVQGGIQKQPSRRPRDNSYPFLRVANVLRGRLDLGEVHRIELFPGELEKYKLAAGDLLIVEGNGSRSEIGRLAIWTGEIPDCVHQNHLIRARPLAGFSPQYLSCYWNSAEGSNAVLQIASSTSGLYTLSVGKVSRLVIPLPPLAEQQRIVAEVERRLSVVERLEATVEANLKRARRLRQAILNRAFEGKLVPQDPTDEPASVLLERIRRQRIEHQKVLPARQPRRRKDVS